MKKMNFLNNAVLCLLGLLQGMCAVATQLAPPKYSVVDDFGVNVPNGQVTTRVDTLSIGGERGLSHSISTHTNNFLLRGGFYTVGTNDKFGGEARYEQLAEQSTYYVKDMLGCLSDCNYGFYVMRVHDHEGSMDFKIKVGNYVVGAAPNATSGYTYEAMSDLRHTLEVPIDKPGYLVWTKPDGTKVWFLRALGPTLASSGGDLEKVIYPNGFQLNFHRGIGDATLWSVTTNTGFQLKYNYVEDYSSNQGIGATNTNISIPKENTINWSLNNPKTIVAVNNAVEYCDTDRKKICVDLVDPCPTLGGGQICKKLTNKWPTARFNWPVGMPRRFYFGENYYEVIDSANRKTKFRVKAFDTAIDENGQVLTGVPANYDFVPRIVGITPAGAMTETVTYDYVNYFNNAGGDNPWYTYYVMPGEVGYLKNAKGISGSMDYSRSRSTWIPGSNPYAREILGSPGISVIQRLDLLGAYYKISDLDGDVYFSENYLNVPARRIAKNGPTETYSYFRGNLARIIYNRGLPSETSIAAGFPSGQCTNAKTCNQADWVSDAKGNKTEYKYHAESGQVERIIYPANKRNIRAETRFKYEQKYAKYYTEAGSKSQSPDGIWLKTEESSCIDSAMDESGNCALNDKVTTRYEYLSDNLFMTGMTVTSQKDGNKTLRTCYQYDIYGNRIGETQPKANLASCN